MLVWRVISAAIGILYLIAALYIRGWFLNLSILFVSLIGMYEFYGAVRNRGYNPVSWLGYSFIVLFFYFITVHPGSSQGLVVILLATIFCLFLTVIYAHITPLDACLTVFGFIYPGMALMSLLLLCNFTDSYTLYLLVFTLFATWSTDTFAYFTGLKMGKNKLCPKISPKKTIEGSIGGLVGSIIIGLLVGLVFTSTYKLQIGYHHYIILSLLCGITSQMGDLSASSIKRYCNIKDFGRILPGHGGILDRFDSIMFTVPVVYAYYLLFLAH